MGVEGLAVAVTRRTHFEKLVRGSSPIDHPAAREPEGIRCGRASLGVPGLQQHVDDAIRGQRPLERRNVPLEDQRPMPYVRLAFVPSLEECQKVAEAIVNVGFG